MKKIMLCLVAFLVLLFLVSCSHGINYRQVNIEIPPHAWEEYSPQKLWYTLKYTDGNSISSLYVDRNTRSISINIPLGETVCICAFPLGDMEPSGTAISPLDESNIFLLTQNGGRLARILMEQEYRIRSNINYPVLCEACLSLTDDFRRINEIELISDIINGKLKKSSVRLNQLTDIPGFTALNGIWVSENEKDGLIQVFDTKIPPMQLPPGVHRFYCSSQNREIKISVDYDGTVSAVMKQSTVPLL